MSVQLNFDIQKWITKVINSIVFAKQHTTIFSPPSPTTDQTTIGNHHHQGLIISIRLCEAAAMVGTYCLPHFTLK
jgi:hypothetical protein